MATSMVGHTGSHSWRGNWDGKRKPHHSHVCNLCGNVAAYKVFTGINGLNEYYCFDHKSIAYQRQHEVWLGRDGQVLWSLDYSEQQED